MEKGEGHFSSKKGSGRVRRGQARSGAVRRFLVSEFEGEPVVLSGMASSSGELLLSSPSRAIGARLMNGYTHAY